MVTVTKAPGEGRSKWKLAFALGAIVTGAAAGFWGTYVFRLDSVLTRGAAPDTATAPFPAMASASILPLTGSSAVAFVPLAPITLNIGQGPGAQILRFGAQLEVPAGREAEVTHLLPRIMDVLNIYLRALDPPELQEASAILRLRGQMLRRAQIVTGPGMVNDLLISEFVMN